MIDELGKQAQDRLVSGDGRRGRYFGTAVVPTLYHVSRTRFEPLERAEMHLRCSVLRFLDRITHGYYV